MGVQPNNLPPIPEKLRDFRTFLVMVWRHLNLPDPTPIQLDFANYLQSGPRRTVNEAFRGVGKSWIAAAFVVWKLRINPNLKFMILSASKDRADNFTTFCLRLITEIPILQCLMPKADQRCSKLSFDVGPAKADHAPSVTSKGIFSQITGGRADIIIADDIEVPGNSFTQAMRDKLSEAVKEFDAILKPGGVIIYLGTPQTEQSLYNSLPDRGYAMRIWPARYPTTDQLANYGPGRLAPYILERLQANPDLAGSSTDPRRFSDDDLLERELSYGRSGFQLQFMLDTRLSDAERYPLKLSDLIVMGCGVSDAPEKPIWASGIGNVVNDIPCVGLNGDRYHSAAFLSGSWIPYTGSVMAIDPSGRGTDETAVCVIKMLNGFLYLTAMKAYRDGYSDATLMDIVRLARVQCVNHVIIEGNFGDGMFTKLISPFFTREHPCMIEEVKHSKQKEARIIDTLEPVMNQHKLVVDRNVIIWDYESTKDLPPEKALKYQLMYQMSRITRDRGALSHDDRLDCLSMAVGYWVEQMGQDADRRMDQRKDELLREELKAWENEGKMSIAKNRVALHQPNLSLTKGAADMLFSFKSLSLGGPLAKADHPRRNRGGLRRVY
ncbi:phage terminase large subunit [Desulfovibrio desulfuricans]|uniref:Terminase, large subunit n=1 Tax=Desulfovibrio phage ProddE TaxID=2866661 RepID=A0AAE9BLZ2_9CAUD|nr:phage terminase large subunit [Desulfovibrio desulfuricans]UAJ16919.1 TerL [Desulfovibrio phage ProddE]UIA98926.1 phage terminase large subunit [Desulfovibrio desulfuricans]